MPFTAITIFEKPKDYPNSFVARRFYGDFPTSDFAIGPTYESVKTWAMETAEKWNKSDPVCFPRSVHDHHTVVETWA